MKLKFLCLILPILYVGLFIFGAILSLIRNAPAGHFVILFTAALTGVFLTWWAMRPNCGDLHNNKEQIITVVCLIVLCGIYFMHAALSDTLATGRIDSRKQSFSIVLLASITMGIWYVCFIPWRRAARKALQN